MTAHGLGRIKDPPDARDHPLARHLAPAVLTEALPARKRAPDLPILDQGDTPQCVTFSGSYYRTAQERHDERRTLGFDEPRWYREAKTLDGFPNEDGTYIRVAADVAKDMGPLVRKSPRRGEAGTRRPIAAYARCQSIDEIKRSIAETRGAWIGLIWYTRWEAVGRARPILPAGGGSVAGGHGIYAGGWSDFFESFECLQSWGPAWGRIGHFYMPYREVEAQLASGDADAWSVIDVAGDRLVA